MKLIMIIQDTHLDGKVYECCREFTHQEIVNDIRGIPDKLLEAFDQLLCTVQSSQQDPLSLWPGRFS